MGITPGGKEHILLRIRKSDLLELFNISIHTLNKWRDQGKLDMRDLKSICELYVQRTR
jgi:phage terminase Nu1 subunit (DNA packaging protein)